MPLTKVVLRAAPFNDTTAPEKKPVPFTVNVKAGPPALTLDGAMLVIAGGAGVMVNVTALEAGPDGLAKVICADPGCAMSVAGTPAVTCVPLTKVVVSAVPFNDTTAPDTKPIPFTVKVKVVPPALTVEGEMLVITGAAGVMVNASALETTLPLLTVTDADPGCAIRFELTVAVN